MQPLAPDGKLFSLRSVFMEFRIRPTPPTTSMLTLEVHSLVCLPWFLPFTKINRVKILYPLQAFFVSFKRYLNQFNLCWPTTEFFSTESYQPTMGNWFQYQCDSERYGDCGLCLMRRLMQVKPLCGHHPSVNQVKLRRITWVWREPQVYRRDYSNAPLWRDSNLDYPLIGLTKGTSLAFSAVLWRSLPKLRFWVEPIIAILSVSSP